MWNRYRLILFILLGFLVTKGVAAQCPQLLDDGGNYVNTPYWVSCTGGNFSLFLQPDINVGNYTVDWGDGTPIENGTDIIPPAFVTHLYAPAVDTFIVTLTDNSNGCIVRGVVVMEQTPTASIVIPFGDPVFGCAPSSFNFLNNTQNVSPTTIFTWDFGDGSPIITTDATNAGQTLTHTYLPQTVNCEVAVTLTAENYCNQGNPSSNTFFPIQVWDIDEAQITASDVLLCYPDTVVDFTNTTMRNCFAQGNTGQRYEWWNFGDYWGQGTDSIINWRPWGPPNNPALTISYPGIGIYDVMMIDSSYCGLDTAYITIQIVDPPTAGFTISEDTICEGEVLTLNNTSGGGANDYSWNFGDGTGWMPSGGGAINYTYGTTGDYIIQLAVFINGGTLSCTDTISFPVHVLPSPVANFNFDDNDGCDTLNVNFTDLSTGGVTGWNWNFGNGNTSILQNPPSQFYNSPGNYDVQLDIVGVNACVNSLTRTINVYQSPTPLFTPTSVCMNEVTNFIDLSTSSMGDPIISWNWDFGDGNSSTQQNPSHTYTSPGPIDIILTVATANCLAIDTISIVVENAPIADFIIDTTNSCSPFTINFNNTSSNNVVNFMWDFGNGDTSILENPSYTYINNFGVDTSFDVRLIVQTAFGCVDTVVQTITVFPNPLASFTNNATLDCAPLTVNFTNNSIGAIQYEWDFGDGSPVDNNINPNHVYQNNTQFINSRIITLIVTSSNGCTDTIRDSILVFPEPDFGFSFNPDSGCTDLLVNFPAVLGAIQYEWDFGDGNTGIGPTPTHVYTNTTTNDISYTVQLIATSPFGCIDTSYGQVVIFPKPSAQFTVGPDIGCQPLPVNIVNNSTGSVFHHWDFGNGTTLDTNVLNFEYIYYNATTAQQNNTIALVAESDKGCLDTTYQVVDVYPLVEASFLSDTVGCSPLTIDFIDNSTGAANYIWDFGDGSPVQNITNPSHQFVNTSNNDVNYTVTLIVESNEGCFDTIQRNILVYATPIASFTATPLSQVYPNRTVSITNTSTPGGWDFNWDFIDTAYQSQQVNFDHSFSTWGDYTITLIVSDSNCADTISELITIIPPLPVANFIGPAKGCRPLDVQFQNNSVYADTYLWDFGDGGTSTQFAPSYTYFNPGIYTVSLTVTGQGGQDVHVQQNAIEVYQLPNAFFTFSPTTVFIPDQPVLFFNLSRDANNYIWDFGDGNTSTEKFPEHYYTQVGVYDIQLIAITSNNCMDTFMVQSAVNVETKGETKIPNAFTPNPNGGNGGVYNPNDMNNDVFHPVITGAEEYELNIFNKWGELLFISKDINIGWDGYYRGELSKQDVYVYKIKVRYIDGKSESFIGDLTLLK